MESTHANATRIVNIGLLDGKSNWTTWKYKAGICLRGIPGAVDIIEGKTSRPADLADGAKPEEVALHKTQLDAFLKIDSTVLLLLTTNMSEKTVEKIMRLTTSREVWVELHRLFDGVSEDKIYDTCLEFFNYQKATADDIATHISKLKNLWNVLKIEMAKDAAVKGELPELFLICKVLGTLQEEYFSFKSSWMLMAKKDRTIDNLTDQLCAYEKALSKKIGIEASTEALVLDSKAKKKNCGYCEKPGHHVKTCRKWIADGRPPKEKKAGEQKATSKTQTTNMLLFAETSEVLNSEADNCDWYVDNGATSHVTYDKSCFKSFELFNASHTISTANGDKLKAVGKGVIEIESVVGGKLQRFCLSDVWYVPCIKKNLFSVLAAHDKVPVSQFVSSANVCHFKVGANILIVGERRCQGGLYKLNMRGVNPSIAGEVNLTVKEDLLQLYHERFGHQNVRHVKARVKSELQIDLKMERETCEGCIYGKCHRDSFGTRQKCTRPGEIIWSDVCGPFEESVSKYKYFVLFKDGYSKFRAIYFMKQKSEVIDKLNLFLAEAEAAGHKVKEFFSDGGGEFDNKKVRELLARRGIIQRITMPYTPEQNGCSERENRTVVEMARAIMYAHGGMPQKLWAEMINTAKYILNRTGPTPIDGKSPYELWYGKKPGLKHLRIIGSTCYAHVPKQRRKKMDRKALKGILIGYDHDEGYRIWDQEHDRLIRSRDVIFEENTLLKKLGAGVSIELGSCVPVERGADTQKDVKCNLPIGANIHLKIDKTAPSGTGTPRRANQHLPSPSEDECLPQERTFDADETWEEFEDCEEDLEEACHEEDESLGINVSVEPSGRVLRDRSKLKPPQRYNEFVAMLTSEYDLPETYQQAVNSDHSDEWGGAMDCEMDAHRDNNTWTLVDLPEGEQAIPCMWRYVLKVYADGSIERFKARLVIKGCSQRKDIDYKETFSPVARVATIRTLLSAAAKQNMVLRQMDVSTAFLYGNLEEEIYMKQPPGYIQDPTKVCKLNKSLYGLKQAPRCWNQRFTSFLLGLGFKRSEADPCLFIRQRGEHKTFFLMYVDDGLIAATDEGELQQLMQDLKSEFKITEKEASYFLGFEIKKEADGSIRISQENYTKRILERHGMSNSRPVSTPMIKDNDREESPLNTTFPYREAVGALMFLMCGTRPDIAYSLSVVSRKLENPTEKDVLKVKRIFRYLQGTADKCIVYRTGSTELLKCYTDADHGGDRETGRSTSGVICFHLGAAISWKSQLQASVAISSTEAEIVAASEGARELIWMKRLFKELMNYNHTPQLFIDNEAAIKLSHNPEFHNRTKHIAIRHFFVREQVTAKELIVKYVNTKAQLADILTKPLGGILFQQLCNRLGIQNI